MVALVNIVKMPDSQIYLTMQVTLNALKSVNIETLQGFLNYYFRNFRKRELIFSVHGDQEGPPPALGVTQG